MDSWSVNAHSLSLQLGKTLCILCEHGSPASFDGIQRDFFYASVCHEVWMRICAPTNA